MTEERKQAEAETMEIIEAIRQGGEEKILLLVAMSYSEGLRRGAEIERQRKTA